MPRCCLSGNWYARQMVTLRVLLRAKKRYICVLTWPVYPVTRTAQGFDLRPLTFEDFMDPDHASTVVDPELDHVKGIDPLD